MIRHPARFSEWPPAGYDGEFAWDFLQPAFDGTRIMPMDLDAVVERCGHYLIFETKAAGKAIDLGQSITLTGLWKEKSMTIIHVQGKSAREITGLAIYSEWEKPKTGRVGQKEVSAADASRLVYLTRCWFCKASGVPQPTMDQWHLSNKIFNASRA